MNGEYYSGEWKNDKRDGQGIWIPNNEDRYMGSFKNDLKHGRGAVVYKET